MENFSGDTLYFMHFHDLNECSLAEFYKMQKSGRPCVMLIRNDAGLVADSGHLNEGNFKLAGGNTALNTCATMKKR